VSCASLEWPLLLRYCTCGGNASGWRRGLLLHHPLLDSHCLALCSGSLHLRKLELLRREPAHAIYAIYGHCVLRVHIVVWNALIHVLAVNCRVCGLPILRVQCLLPRLLHYRVCVTWNIWYCSDRLRLFCYFLRWLVSMCFIHRTHWFVLILSRPDVPHESRKS
jgi:hypothetical protein